MHAILGWLQGQMRDLHNLDVRIESGRNPDDDPDVRVLLFQIFRELLFTLRSILAWTRQSSRSARRTARCSSASQTRAGVSTSPAS